MKNNILKLIIPSLIIISCSGSGGNGGGVDPTPTPTPNSAPTVPSLISPTNQSLCISNALTFNWNTSTDAQNDAITYQIQIATDNQFTQIINSSTVNSTSYTFTLDKGKAYYWRVKAIDSKNASSEFSTTNSLYTEANATTNHLPFMPQLVKPAQDTNVNTTVDLEWNASDVDTSDVLSYDIYWGTSKTNLTNSKTNVSTKTTQITGLQATTTYFWRVVVKDNKGGETIGQIWSFKTN
ncbi:hypothetical protein GCM10010992_23980 [Cloacibacterium rupense]|uniref:Fibronectin type-III domain-containing protein n=1 Tax=Cloacibacterium rupense TaxID=517423 RepID=A0ABQ2NNP2_9FLAO|nr:fibronectin type III domain-containing protein [Cloacibacterium rupense]GGP05901.1 hypothetical protein GCM10010992_23980 [Cloacibacterium rupense]